MNKSGKIAKSLGQFFKDDEKKGPSRPKEPRFWRRGWLRSQRAQNFYEIPKLRNFKFRAT